MKLTKSQLKQIIKEELSNIEEAEMTPEEFADLRAQVDPETFIYDEEMEAIKAAMEGLRRDVRWELKNNLNLREKYEDSPSAGPMTKWAVRLSDTILADINRRHDDMKKALASIASKNAAASEAADIETTVEDEL